MENQTEQRGRGGQVVTKGKLTATEDKLTVTEGKGEGKRKTES